MWELNYHRSKNSYRKQKTAHKGRSFGYGHMRIYALTIYSRTFENVILKLIQGTATRVSNIAARLLMTADTR